MRWLRLRRQFGSRPVEGSALARCWDTPLPVPATDWRDVPFLAVDAEMSSLDAETGELLSLGWVAIEHAAIQMQSARHIVIRATESVGQSATVHQLRDCDLTNGVAPAQALEALLAAAAGRILVFHHAGLDLAYLDRLSHAVYGSALLLPAVDTLLQEKALLERRDHALKPGDLRLATCRARYGLPPYPAHNALADALATAELLLAHASRRASGQALPLRQLLN